MAAETPVERPFSAGMWSREPSMPGLHKRHLPEKTCPACGRPFVWRRKWARDWENVVYCSERCRRTRAPANNAKRAPPATQPSPAPSSRPPEVADSRPPAAEKRRP